MKLVYIFSSYLASYLHSTLTETIICSALIIQTIKAFFGRTRKFDRLFERKKYLKIIKYVLLTYVKISQINRRVNKSNPYTETKKAYHCRKFLQNSTRVAWWRKKIKGIINTTNST
jgi:hypothetical protein